MELRLDVVLEIPVELIVEDLWLDRSLRRS